MPDVHQPLSVHLVTLFVPVLVMSGWLWWRGADVPPEPVPQASADLLVPLDVRVGIAHDGFHLLGVSDVLPQAPTDAAGGVRVPCGDDDWCRSPDDYDFETLGYLLAAVKHRRPDASAVSVVPQYQTPYGTIVRTLRAVQAVRASPDGPVAFPQVAISGPGGG